MPPPGERASSRLPGGSGLPAGPAPGGAAGLRPLSNCVDFVGLSLTNQLNPFVFGGVRFEARDAASVPCPYLLVGAEGNFIGLRVGYELEVRPTNLCSRMEIGLAPSSAPTEPVAMAFDARGRIVDTATPNQPAATARSLTVQGEGIASVIIATADASALLHRICYWPRTENSPQRK